METPFHGYLDADAWMNLICPLMTLNPLQTREPPGLVELVQPESGPGSLARVRDMASTVCH